MTKLPLEWCDKDQLDSRKEDVDGRTDTKLAGNDKSGGKGKADGSTKSSLCHACRWVLPGPRCCRNLSWTVL